MARLTLDTRYINQSLEDLSMRLAAAMAWMKGKQGPIPLEIPEPFNHPVGHHGPSIREVCLQPDPVLEECSEIGILMGILKAMPKPARKAPKAKGTSRSRK